MASPQRLGIYGRVFKKAVYEKEALTLESHHDGELLCGAFESVTDDAYPHRDARIHHMVRHCYFFDTRLQLSRRYRVDRVVVALCDKGDYVRLGLPRRVRDMFLYLNPNLADRSRLLDDPLYANTDDVWWVRAWPTSTLATTVAADGSKQSLDAAEIVRRTGRGFTVTATLQFDFFFAPAKPRVEEDGGDHERAVARLCADGFRTLDADVIAHGPVVTVLRSVISGLHDGRPPPQYRHGADGADDTARPGCHLPAAPVSPDAVLAQLTDLGLLGAAAGPAATGADDENANHKAVTAVTADNNHNHKVVTTATTDDTTTTTARRTEDPRRDRPLPEDHVKMDPQQRPKNEIGRAGTGAARRVVGWAEDDIGRAGTGAARRVVGWAKDDSEGGSSGAARRVMDFFRAVRK